MSFPKIFSFPRWPFSGYSYGDGISSPTPKFVTDSSIISVLFNLLRYLCGFCIYWLDSTHYYVASFIRSQNLRRRRKSLVETSCYYYLLLSLLSYWILSMTNMVKLKWIRDFSFIKFLSEILWKWEVLFCVTHSSVTGQELTKAEHYYLSLLKNTSLLTHFAGGQFLVILKIFYSWCFKEKEKKKKVDYSSMTQGRARVFYVGLEMNEGSWKQKIIREKYTRLWRSKGSNAIRHGNLLIYQPPTSSYRNILLSLQTFLWISTFYASIYWSASPTS